MKIDDRIVIIGLIILVLISQRPFAVTEEKKVDTVAVNDISNSMEGSKLIEMKSATKTFSSTILTGGNNTVGLVAYATKTKQFMNLTRDETALHNHIDNYEEIGTTCISCGIQTGTEILNVGNNYNKAMLVMTDGKANSCIGDPRCASDTAEWEAKQHANTAKADGIELYCVAFGVDADVDSLTYICGSGNVYYASELPQVLEDLYEDLAEEIIWSPPPEVDVWGIFNDLFNQIWETLKALLGWV